MPEYELTAVFGIGDERSQQIAEKCSCKVAQTVDELLETKPDIVVEVASIEAVQEYVIKVLKHGIPFVALSIGAFVDAAFYEKQSRQPGIIIREFIFHQEPSADLTLCRPSL